MPVQWTFEIEESLIEKVRSRPILWNQRILPTTRKRLKSTCMARELQEAFPHVEGIDADAVVMKFSILKTSFRRELAKIKQVKSGSGGDYVPKWRLFELMLFLTDVVTPGRVHQTLRLLCLRSPSPPISRSPSPPISRSPSPPISRSLRPPISRIPSYPNLF
ncbi:uncharacterized protein [Macrobrachium rosenbergii]|uniref:uncharacterized protein n=1 Tax=Macrobrachium rosenbergii TaxID=79674 RepID=UPI0034D5447D